MSVPAMIVVFCVIITAFVIACAWLMFEETDADRAFRNEYKKQLAEKWMPSVRVTINEWQL